MVIGRRITTNHKEIIKWVEERGGRPAKVTETTIRSLPSSLRINFSEGESKELENIPWEEFFALFEEHKLALFLDEKTETGDLSKEYAFFDRENIRKKETYHEPSEE